MRKRQVLLLMGAFFLVGGCEEEASREQENGDEIDSLVFASFTDMLPL